eukprot:scaffold47535_cov62-Attheya_sp.AAC.2
MDLDDAETFAVFDPMVLDPEGSVVDLLIEDVTPSAPHPSVALHSPPGISGTSFTMFNSSSIGLVSPINCWIASELCVAGSLENQQMRAP